MLVDGLSDERARWEKTVASLGELFERLPGDCLISTAFVSYLGPFVSNYREELSDIWLKEVKFYYSVLAACVLFNLYPTDDNANETGTICLPVTFTLVLSLLLSHAESLTAQ